MGPPCCLIPRSACIIFLLLLLMVQIVAMYVLGRCILLSIRIIPALWGDKPTELVRISGLKDLKLLFWVATVPSNV